MSSFTTPLTAYNPEQVGVETTSDGSVWFFVTSDSDSRNNSTVISTGVAQMNAILVYWQESDLEKFDTGYASELAEALLPSNTFAPSVTTTGGRYRDLTAEQQYRQIAASSSQRQRIQNRMQSKQIVLRDLASVLGLKQV